MKPWPRLPVALLAGFVAWGSVGQFGPQLFPNSTGLLPGVAIATGLACGCLALLRSTKPLIGLLAMDLLALGLGYLVMTTASGDGLGMAGVMLALLASLFALGAAPAAATHGLLAGLEHWLGRRSHTGS